MRHLRPGRIAAAIVSSLILFTATPSIGFLDFSWDGSPAERVFAKGFDVVVVRPVSCMRLVVGAVLALPAALVAAPNGREGMNEVFDVFVVQPANYAFRRELGDF
jgi:hypothetical protein